MKRGSFHIMRAALCAALATAAFGAQTSAQATRPANGEPVLQPPSKAGQSIDIAKLDDIMPLRSQGDAFRPAQLDAGDQRRLAHQLL